MGKGTGGVPIHGTGTNDSAAAGYVGEYISSQVLNASAVSLSTGANTNITSISLTPGDWDVSGNIYFSVVTGPATAFFAWINTVSVTRPDNSVISEVQINTTGTGLQAQGMPIFTQRVSVPASTTTTVYLGANAVFSAGSASASGFIGARRTR